VLQFAGASGDETVVREYISEKIKPHVDEVHVDHSGNLVAHHKGKGQKVMLAAHMDEIGLMVEEITEDGYIKFSTVGGISGETLLSQQVHIKGNKGIVHGVISYELLHTDAETEEFPEIKEMYVDVGAKSRKEVEDAGICVGNYIIPRRAFATLINKDIISGKALDDRVGCAMLIELAKRLKKSKKDIYFVFTVQEEVGLYGAKAAMYEITPDWGIAVDATNSEDFNSDKKGIGRGPCITVKDSELIANKELVEQFVRVAKRHKIPYQLEVTELGSTDALAMAISKGGIPATAISFPVRNIHSTISIANMKDVRNGIKLITYGVEEIKLK